MCRQEGFLVKVTGLLQCGTNTGPSAPLRLNPLREVVAEVWPHGLGRHDPGFRMETVCEQAPGPFPLTRLHHSSLPLPPAPEKETELTQTAHWWHLGSGHSVSQGYRAVRRIEWCWPAYLASVCYVFRCGCSNWKCPGALYNPPPPPPPEAKWPHWRASVLRNLLQSLPIWSLGHRKWTTMPSVFTRENRRAPMCPRAEVWDGNISAPWAG